MPQNINIKHIQQIDRGLAYAEACFETFRIIDGEIFRWKAHWQRLNHGLNTFGISLDPSWQQTIYNACLEYAKEIAPDCFMRLTVSGGDADWGLLSTATKINVQLQSKAFIAPPTNNLSPFISVEYPFPLRTKVAKFTSDYADTLKAVQIWNTNTINPQQYIICKAGMVISGLTSNIILYHQGRWLTPRGDGVLDGVMRQFLLEKGLVQPQQCPTTLLDTCEAILLLNSGQFLRPVYMVNGRSLNPQHDASVNIRQVLRAEKGIKLHGF